MSYSYQRKLTARKIMMRRRRIFFGVVSLVMVLGIFFIVMISSVKPGSQVFFESVILDGIYLGDMTKEEAKLAVEQQIERKEAAMEIQIKFEDQTWTVHPKDLGVVYDTEAQLDQAYRVGRTGSWFARRKEIRALQEEPYIGKTTMTYDIASLTRVMAEVKALIDLPAIDASLEFRPEKEEKFLFSKESSGRQINLDDLINQVKSLLDHGMGGSVVAKATPVEPKVTVADLEPNTVRIAKVTTSMKGSSENRTHNIQLAMSAFNGMTLQPDEIFSFNDIVGPRTEEAGYRMATVILRGEYTDDFGGGICQPSTTLYHAVVLSDLEVIERHHHTIPSSYVPVGQDATVDYGNSDFMFKNNSGYPIYIRAVVSGDNCEISFYGRPLPEGVSIEMETEIVSTTPAPEPIVQIDADNTYLSKGQAYVDSPKSRPGYSTKTYKVYYQGEGKNKVETERVRLSSDTFKASQGTRWVPAGSPLLLPPTDPVIGDNNTTSGG